MQSIIPLAMTCYRHVLRFEKGRVAYIIKPENPDDTSVPYPDDSCIADLWRQHVPGDGLLEVVTHYSRGGKDGTTFPDFRDALIVTIPPGSTYKRSPFLRALEKEILKGSAA